MSRRLNEFLLICAGVCWLTACAYYSTSGGAIGGIRSLAVPVAENETSEFEIAELLSERLSGAYSRDGQLRVVDEEGSDAVIYLRVVALDDAPFTYTAGEVTEQYRFRVYVAAELLRTENEEELLKLERLEGWGIYDAALADEEGRDLAVEKALEMVIEEIVDRTTAGW